jgi:hypothetical protein
VTPFDAVALVAMLVAFYPAPTVAHLRRARDERPEYFAGGILFGSAGEKLRLPDGRVFDLIFDAGGAAAHWQALDVTDSGPAPDDLFPLEEGPLVPLDAETPGPVAPVDSFAALVGAALGSLGPEDGVIAGAHQVLAEASSSDALLGSYSATVGAAEGALADELAAAGTIDTAGLIEASAAISDALEATDAEYDVPPPRPALPPLQSHERPEDEEPTGTAVPRGSVPPPSPPAPGAPPPGDEPAPQTPREE